MNYKYVCSRCGKDILDLNQFNKCGRCVTPEERHIIQLEQEMLIQYLHTPNDRLNPSAEPTHFQCTYTDEDKTTFDKYVMERCVGTVITQTKYLKRKENDLPEMRLYNEKETIMETV